MIRTEDSGTLPSQPEPKRSRELQTEHLEFIAAYNQVVEEEGLPLESWRLF